MSPAFHGGTAWSCCAPLQAFLSAVLGSLLVASKYRLVLLGAAQGLSEGTHLGMLVGKTENFSCSYHSLLEEVFQVKFLVKVQEETGFVQGMVLAVRKGSRGAMSPGLSPSGCCGSFHHPGEWNAADPIPLNKHMQLWKAFLSCWWGTGGTFIVFQKCFPAWKWVFWPIFIESFASQQLAHILYGQGGYSVSLYATLSSNVMHRAETACCDMLGGPPLSLLSRFPW